MNFYVIAIIAICITLEGVTAAPLSKSEHSSNKVSKSQDNGKRKLIELDAEVHDYWWDLFKRAATIFGYTGEPSSDIKDKLAPWPGARIPYIIDDDFDDVQRRILMEAIDEFHQYTCVRFVPRYDEEAFINIVSSSDGCSSRVGYFGTSYDVHLQSGGCGERKGSVMHELMHVIGFIHEQGRHDRDDYVTIQWANVQPGAEINFNRYENKDLNDLGFPYDFGSLMHYPDNAFSINGGRTIIPKVTVDLLMGQREGFSQNDLLRINKMYQCQ